MLSAIAGTAGIALAWAGVRWLAWLRPAPETLSVGAVLAANLAAAWETFRQAGVEQIVLARALQSAGELEMIRGALPRVDVVPVRLTVSPSLQEQRLRVRDTGRELAEHLALLAGGEAPVFEDTTVANDDLPSAVAAEVLAAAGWAPL